VAPHRVKPVVAVIFDFDDTLAPDSTSQLLESLGVDVPKFWRDEVGWGRAWGFIEEKRAMNLCPTDFSSGSPTETVRSMALQSVCDSIEREGQ
jgi:hypothetical protein